MSILNGNISGSVIHATEMPFGSPYNELALIKLSGAMDCASLTCADGELLVCACKGTLEIYRLEPGADSITPHISPVHISTLTGIGESRQISISGGFAYVSTRADGVDVCDLREPESPKLAHRIDTLELATGVSAANGILAVTNRHMGCELFDVRDPYRPVRLNDFLCGEAQSVWLYTDEGRGYALIGDWMNKQVRIFDITSASDIRELSRFGVDGFADGVCAFRTGGRIICLAATGHHSARLKNRQKYRSYSFVTPEMLAGGYGCGHGVEIFDVTEPTQPEYLSSLKAPPLFGGIDTWRVFCDGEVCIFTDSMNGLFAIDLSELTNPVFLKHFRLPPNASQRISPPSIQIQCGEITGAASVGGLLCAASRTDGVHILGGGFKNFIKPTAVTDFSRREYSVRSADYRMYFRGGDNMQIHSFAGIGDKIVCACGEAGMAVLIPDAGTPDARIEKIRKTDSVCHDVCVCNNKIVTAEGKSGAGLYDFNLTELSRIDYGEALSVREVVCTGDGTVCAELGSGFAVEIGVSDSLIRLGKPCPAGLLYHRHIARTAAGRYLITMAISTGPMLLSIDDGGLARTGLAYGQESCPFADGACGFGGRLICVLGGRYACFDEPERIASPDSADFISIDGAKFDGLPFVCGDKLAILNRYSGRIELLDLADPHSPKLIKRIETGLYPEFAAEIGGRILVACGHAGIIEI